MIMPNSTFVCAEQRRLPVQRATYEYLKGKILDVFPDYRKEAEDHLSKAVSENTLLVQYFTMLILELAASIMF